MSVEVPVRRAAGFVPALGSFLALVIGVVGGSGGAAIYFGAALPLVGIAFAVPAALALVTLARGVGVVTGARARLVLDGVSMTINDGATLTGPVTFDAEDIMYAATIRVLPGLVTRTPGPGGARRIDVHGEPSD